MAEACTVCTVGGNRARIRSELHVHGRILPHVEQRVRAGRQLVLRHPADRSPSPRPPCSPPRERTRTSASRRRPRRPAPAGDMEPCSPAVAVITGSIRGASPEAGSNSARRLWGSRTSSNRYAPGGDLRRVHGCPSTSTRSSAYPASGDERERHRAALRHLHRARRRTPRRPAPASARISCRTGCSGFGSPLPRARNVACTEAFAATPESVSEDPRTSTGSPFTVTVSSAWPSSGTKDERGRSARFHAHIARRRHDAALAGRGRHRVVRIVRHHHADGSNEAASAQSSRTSASTNTPPATSPVTSAVRPARSSTTEARRKPSSGYR